MSHDGEGTSNPDLAQLADWLEGRLDPLAAARTAAAVEHGSREFEEATEWVRRFTQDADREFLPEPPPVIQQRLRQSFSDWRDGRDHRSPAAVAAVLAFDSRVDGAARALRGATDRNTIHLAYRADLAELVLDIRMLGRDHARVDGQVFPHVETDAPIFEVTATSPEVVIRVVNGDRLGRFHLARIPLRRYDLAISNGEFTVSAPLDLEHPRPRS